MADRLEEAQVRQIFIDSHALMTGHFRLSSGRHSDEYWEKFWVLQHPQHVQTLCGEIARRLPTMRWTWRLARQRAASCWPLKWRGKWDCPRYMRKKKTASGCCGAA